MACPVPSSLLWWGSSQRLLWYDTREPRLARTINTAGNLPFRFRFHFHLHFHFHFRYRYRYRYRFLFILS